MTPRPLPVTHSRTNPYLRALLIIGIVFLVAGTYAGLTGFQNPEGYYNEAEAATHFITAGILIGIGSLVMLLRLQALAILWRPQG